MNYIDEARKQWPAATRIIGEGRFAVSGQNGGIVYLAMTESQQRSIALGIDRPVLVDLKPKFVPDIRETAEDRYEERLRAKRAARQ